MEVVDSEISNASAATAATIDAHTAPTVETTEAAKMDTGESIATLLRNVHIPYILNGELYEIQSQDGENVTVKCCHCPPDRVYRGSVRSTGNFHMHIKRRHPDLLGKLHDMKVNALLERRERYIRNRRVSTGRNRHISGTSGGRVVKRELLPLPISPTQHQQRSALSLMHTHKLKIKRAFQRHLQQQQQLQHWSVPSFVTTPAPELNFTPINYSLKERWADEAQQDIKFATLQSGPEIQANYLLRQTKPSEQSLACEMGEVCSLKSQYPHTETPCLNNEPVSAYAGTTAANTPSPSVISSRGSQAGADVNGSIRCRHNTIGTTVENEHLLLPEAVDLSMQASVGSLSSGIGSMADTLTCGGIAGSNSASTTASNPVNSSHNTNTANIANPKWSELLSQVETSLRDIQHEMRMRNQIETNRIFLDIAKFKYLHPGFNFHY